MFYQGEFRKCSGEAFFFFVLQFDFCLLNDFDFSRLYQHGVLLIVFTAILESVTFSSPLFRILRNIFRAFTFPYLISEKASEWQMMVTWLAYDQTDEISCFFGRILKTFFHKTRAKREIKDLEES